MRNLIWIVFVLAAHISFGQSSFIQTLHDQNDAPLRNVLVQDANGVCKAISDENGRFELNCANKINTLQFILNGEVISEMSADDFSAKSNVPLKLSINKAQQESQNMILINLPSGSEGDNDQEEVSSLLASSRDVFSSIAGFSFSNAGFDIRGYENEYQMVFINNVPVNDPESGNSFFSTWGGLNDVMRTDRFVVGLNQLNNGFGNIGGAAIIDATAATQRKQNKVSYAFSNRAFQHRIMATASTGVLQNGWAFSASGSHRWANEAYVPGTFLDSWAYYLAAEKRFKNGDQFSFTVFGSPTRRGKAAPSVQEMNGLAGTNYYNPNWGFQNGEVRNAKVVHTHLPTAVLGYNKKIGSKTQWNNGLSFQTGREGNSNLDWFDAPDPRPDYYRRLPSYANNPDAAAEITQLLKTNESARQINWQELYNINDASFGTVTNANGIPGNTVSGKISKYLVNERRTDNTILTLNSFLNHEISDRITLTGGVLFRNFKGENYQTALDLLGGDFIVDRDRFAERDFPNDSIALQNDLNTPNKIVKEGEKYAYNYNTYIRTIQPWAQIDFKLKKVDFFAATQVGSSTLWRDGLVKNGRFPENSLGESVKEKFTTYGFKSGITYKINGRNYLYANGAYITQAPLLKDLFLSPRTRNAVAPNLKTEKTLSGEVGYLLRSPVFKARVTAYFTQIRDLIRTTSFYHDELRTFVNFTLNGIGRTHMGTEIGLDYKLSPSFTIQGAASIGDYYYDTRPVASISQDNNNTLIAENRTIYQNDFFVPNTPQTALGLSLRYFGPHRMFANVNVSYFDKMYIDFNPDRRTNVAVSGLDDASEVYKNIINQEKLDPAYTVDMSIGKSWNVKKLLITLNFNINNLLNNTTFKTGGFEQLRFDYAEKNVNKFPPKYFYLYGLSYGLNLGVTF
ncbi:MAG: TonB-dependent receptor [Saprospiraceae bacterium]|nr:TonB-dependent receptor [Saprospiraceae bacterium]